MRRRTVVWSVLSSSAVLAVGWQLGSPAGTVAVPNSSTAPDASAATSGSTTGSAAAVPSTVAPASPTPSTSTPSTSTPSASAPAAAARVSGTFTGSSVSTQFGNVQVQVVVSDGSITDVVALHLTDADGRSVSISNRAAPVLRTKVLAAQSASVQGVSGATYTSDAYLTSLQSALDQAGL